MNKPERESDDSNDDDEARSPGKPWGKIVAAVGTVIGVAIIYVVQHWPSSPSPAEGTVRVTKVIWCERFAGEAITVDAAVRTWNDECTNAKHECVINVSNAELTKMAGGICWTEHQGVRIQYRCDKDGVEYPQSDEVTGADEDNVPVTLRCRFSK